MSIPCGCCEGIQALTPAPNANRPGLTALVSRAGTHATFLETMKARLTTLSLVLPPEVVADGVAPVSQRLRPLLNLTTRDGGDAAIALLDAWATVADVLTFYEERIANEGYLRTAVWRRSVLELARLIGYTLRPGVAATVYLAYTLDDDRSVTPPKPTVTTIPAGTRAQSSPGPGELPQSFETADDLAASSAWSVLGIRLTRPQTEHSIKKKGLYLKGIATNLKPNDPILIDFGVAGRPLVPFRVIAVTPEPARDRTHVTIRLWRAVRDALDTLAAALQRLGDKPAPLVKLLTLIESKLQAASPAQAVSVIKDALDALGGRRRDDLVSEVMTELELVRESLSRSGTQEPVEDQTATPSVSPIALGDLLPALQATPSIPPPSAAALSRSLADRFSARSDAVPRLLTAFRPILASTLYSALAGSVVTPPSAIRAYALRLTTGLFGANAPKPPKATLDAAGSAATDDWPIIERTGARRVVHEDETVVNLDATYDKVVAHGWVMVETADTGLTVPGLLITRAQAVQTVGRAQYGMSGKVTRIRLGKADADAPSPTWIELAGKTFQDNDFDAIRRAVVYAQSDELQLAEEPIDEPIGACDPNALAAAVSLELDGVYAGLEAGRWAIVTGERLIAGTSGVTGSELVMLAGTEQRHTSVPGDTVHTVLTLAADLAYCYKRDTVTVYGNVVKATHGETRTEVLGSGDTGSSLQQFTLRQSPLTFVSARTPAGVHSTLQVRVNDLLWHETDSLAALTPVDRGFITRTDDDDKTIVVFGNGAQGARLPTGQGNVKAVYRNGIGRPGNVQPGQISILATRPLGVKAVTNPIRASGGADRESRDQARENAPLAVLALDRLVSTQDYADFARTFAGVGKASAVRLSDGRRQVVHVTIAGADDIPIEPTSDLHRNLVAAFHDFGDSHLPILVDVRELLALVVSAGVSVLPDYQWVAVEASIRAAMLEAFGFARRALGQSVFLSEVIGVIQAVMGVAYVDVDVLGSVSEPELASPDTLAQKIAALQAQPRPDPVVRALLAQTIAQAAGSRARSTSLDGVYSAQLAFLTPDVPATLVLNQR
jgi:hypothetical protein